MDPMAIIRNISIASAALMALAVMAPAQTAADGEFNTPDQPAAARSVPVSGSPAVANTPGKDAGTEKDGADDVSAYYNQYLREYRLGPGDIISVEVFGQCPDYCRANVAIPPNARISYPLIKEGLMVAGLTVEQVAAEITKRLDEYIIDPNVTVTLNKVVATRFSVMGNVAQPGIKIMDRKISLYDAVIDAGGVTPNGDRKKVMIVNYGKDGRLAKRLVNFAEIEDGKADMVYLSPGDQVFVAGKGFTFKKLLLIATRASSALTLFGVPGVPYIPSF
jgi:protein involved in polysaccharide export with SLBB domain